MHRLRVALRWQIMAVYLPLLIPILVIGVVIRGVAENGLTVLVTQEAENQARGLSHRFVGYYALHNSWDGVGTLLVQPIQPGPIESNSEPPPSSGPPANRKPRQPPAQDQPLWQPTRPEQILIASPEGIILASNDSSVVGQTLSAQALSSGAPLIVDGRTVGTLVIGAALGLLDQQQRQLLDTLNGALWLSGGLSVVFTVILGLWLSRTITAPIQQLMQGVHGLASGQWTTPLVVQQSNELGDLTRTFNHMAETVTREQHLRRQMVADIAHDLRTPLSIMALEVEGIRAGIQTPVEAASSLQEEIEWLQRLVDDLHTLSLMDADQLDLYPEPIALYPFLQSIASQWQPIAEREHRKLAVALPPELPITCIDPHRMRQVLGNLLNNAVQHTVPGSQITLSAEQRNEQVTISVQDNGPGIDPQDLPHLFERFYRADRSRKRRPRAEGGGYYGSGLGLAIAYQLVSLQNGQLTVRSAPGQGADFSVTLPIVRSESVL